MPLTSHLGPELLTVEAALTEAFVEIFTSPPWHHRDPATEHRVFRERLARDVHRPGFRAVIATDDDGDILGFATGWTTPSPFPADRAYGKVAQRLGADRAESLLVGAFEVDELGIRARARGTGLGRRLLAAVTAAAPDGRSWLLTWNQAHDALAFYRHTGWQELPPVSPGRATNIVVFLSPPSERQPASPQTQSS